MSEIDLLEECKKGLNIPTGSTAFDGILKQKIMAVKGFMLGAGVKSAKIKSDLGIGVLVLGVSDLWELKSGEVKFSSAFNTLLTQLSMGAIEEDEEDEV